MTSTLFPRIEHIDQVLAHFEGRNEFTVGTRDGFTVIDYNYILPDTFDDPVRLEGRGMKFCSKTGKILARPFHKFFNLSEKPHTQFEALPWHLPFVVQEKYDGSMIHPAIIDGKLLLMTRKGVSDVAQQAMRECLTPELAQQMRECVEWGATPVFEYTSPNNRIVIEYEKPALRLLAMRKMICGTYESNSNLFDGLLGSNLDPRSLVDTTRQARGREGVVISWPYTGLRVKLKADEYVALHRAIDTMSSEKRILDVILDNKDDDLCAMVSQDRADKIRNYAAIVRNRMQEIQQLVESFVTSKAHLDQKTFALEIMSGPYKLYSSEVFSCRANKLNGYEIGKQFIQRHSRTQADLDRNREIVNIPKLQPLAFNTGDA